MILKFCSVVYSVLWWRDDNNLTIGNELINWSIIRTSPISRFHKLHCTEKPMRLLIDHVMMRLSLIGVVALNDANRLIISQQGFLSSKIEWFIFRLHAMTSTFKCIISVISWDKRRIFFWWNISKQNKSIYKAELGMFTCNTYGTNHQTIS